MRVNHPRPGTLQITKSRKRAASHVAFMVVFFVGWYSMLFAARRAPDAAPTYFMLLFWFAPLFSLPEMIRQVRVLTSGETFMLTHDTGAIERNGTLVARFRDVARLQIRTIRHGNGDSEHRLSIVLRNDEKLRIDQSSNTQEIADIADDLADILGVGITRKG